MVIYQRKRKRNNFKEVFQMARQKSNSVYEVDKKGESLKRKNQPCPRCQGSFLAEHKNRRSCGKCGYSEYKR